MTTYGMVEFGKHLFNEWFVAWRLLAITCIGVLQIL